MGEIRKPYDSIVVKSIKTLIYGQPGVRKTSFAFTAENALLIDCDRGIRRLAPQYRKDYMEVNSWEDIAALSTDERIKPYDTVIIDTAGKMMDFLAAWLMKGNKKFEYQGSPTLQCYGAILNHFRLWLNEIEVIQKNLIFVAHERVDKEGEQTIIRPDIRGASMQILIREMDLVGYMESRNDVSTLSFYPTDRYYGKNSCEITNIKDLNTSNMNMIHERYIKQQATIASLTVEYEQAKGIIETKVESMKDAAAAKKVAKELEAIPVIWDSLLYGRSLFAKKLTSLGLVYIKDSGAYEKITPPAKVAEAK